MKRLSKHCEEAMKSLSCNLVTEIFGEDVYSQLESTIKITRAKFEYLCSDLFNNISSHIKTTLEEARISKDKVEGIILSGGFSQAPKIKLI
mmetsp:Transcript_24607/g.21833  ORF Transcript_24607/g.21833 Transcript_24607/m.21833 type:complete len:91 (-) Transcript_24607:317-589(-)